MNTRQITMDYDTGYSRGFRLGLTVGIAATAAVAFLVWLL